MKASYANMKLKINTEVEKFDFCGQEIEVLQYLPTQDKYDLLMITLQEAFENGIYNEFKLQVYFELNLVYMYSNISFTEKQKEDELKIYDNLNSNGFFKLFFENMNENEYNDLLMNLENIKNDKMAYNTTVKSVLQSLIDDLPSNAEAAAKIVENFAPEKYKAVVDFAKAANGGRNIN